MTAALYVEDVLLVDRCLTGEPAATRELFRRHRHRVHACLFRVLGGNRDMDDLLQDAFLQVFQSLRGWRAEASLATWIDRVAVRCAYRYLSQRGRRVATEPLDTDDVVMLASAHEGAGTRRQLARDGVRRLYAVLDELSPAARLAFTLHEIDGRSLAETAALVGSSVTATKLRVWRARKRLEAAAAADPVLSEFLEPTAGGEVIPFDERSGIAGGGDPDGCAGGAGVRPREIDERSGIAGGGDPDGCAGGAGVRPREIDERSGIAGGGDPDGCAGGAGVRPREIDERSGIAGGGDPDGCAGGAGVRPREIEERSGIDDREAP